MTTEPFTKPTCLTCPACEQQVEFLFSSTGICLDCEIDLWHHTVEPYEEREAQELWGEAEMACPVCGID